MQMLYGNQKTQNEILHQVKNFENSYNKKVVFGAVLGSISQGIERYDSDYDSRFLYFDPMVQDCKGSDMPTGDLYEDQIHQCYIPKGGVIGGASYRNGSLSLADRDKELFYDKIAFWELTSFIGFLVEPKIEGIISANLYHTVNWTFYSPFCWDPYGLKNKISYLIDEMFIPEYEIQFYCSYIQKAIKKKSVSLKEYLCSIYYALAIEYTIKHNRFAPIYFRSLLATCNDDKLKNAIFCLEKRYYDFANEKIKEGQYFERKMTILSIADRVDIIDNYIMEVLTKALTYNSDHVKINQRFYADKIIALILNAIL